MDLGSNLEQKRGGEGGEASLCTFRERRERARTSFLTINRIANDAGQ